MWDIDSSPAEGLRISRSATAAGWFAFALVNVCMMFAFPGKETIPYHLIWASFALLYGLHHWSRLITWFTFWAVTVVTGIALLKHASSGIIGWEECSEIVLMGVLVALLIWHVNRHRAVQDRLNELRDSDRIRAHNREVAARFGSHEVRTHLTVARGFAEMIRDSAKDDLVRSDAALVLTELDKASALATKLLTWVRIDTVSAGIPMHLGELLGRISARWAATTDRDLRCDAAVGVMLGDSERLEAAFDCLIENAVKFTEPGDRIVVSARVIGDDVVMSVSDTGTGIPRSDLHRITEVFQTGSSAGDRAGSGLGLAIVRAIVEARGGSLSVDSTEGVGTTVSIVMRSYGAEQAPAVASAAVAEATAL